ncbi:nucleoside triphosphate pyrophosphohydrolase/pyrophosphatase MazG [Andreesenia angusta]|uniref:Nucleoside triphosphate pyrophosphohydrolase/pyrophosphatase MazG n=1 Tax=Andreesenia angusta TaxID=39480 RepID=A0A1S1V5T5_9FIRM|nr:nucleoside triphosphate pyrophosphohydrolase [Andreesenia angusta]OHW61760.1 nucleoside triphosphate pyrophosphohydrolase/pyrophosphatase MazG [Andreesenia angusta]
MNKIVVIGLGPGAEDALTLGAAKNLREKRKTYLRTEKHPTVSYLKREEIEYETYDKVYDSKEEFEDVYSSIVEDLIEQSDKYGTINYCVPGHPLIAEKTVELLLGAEKEERVELEIVEGLSFIEPVILSMQSDPVEGLKIIDGLDLKNQKVDISVDNLVTQVYNQTKASELKLELSEIYGDEYEVYIIKAAGVPGEEKKIKVPVYELDRLGWIDYLTSIYIPKVQTEDKRVYDFNDLLKIMETLRGEDGCPWDIKQTNESLKKYVIEEAYELVEAIEEDDIDGIVEELGDVLLQVVFHSQIGREEGYFNIWDVIRGISEKMVNRHPHVFGDGVAETDSEVKRVWDDIKASEKEQESHQERLRSVPKVLPALIRSEKVQKRASKCGFDWDDRGGAVEKLREEVEELIQEIDSNGENIDGELGDILFSVVNLSRFLDVDPERALYKSVDKFIDRFSKVEDEVLKSGRKMEDMGLDELDEIWEEVKSGE